MDSRDSQRIISSGRFSQASAAAVLLMGMAVLAGWMFDVPALKSPLFAVFSALVFALLVWWSSHRLFRAEGERLKLQEELRKSEERYRTVAQTATDAIVSIDGDSTILLANPAAERLFGFAREEMLGAKLTMLMPEYLRHVHEAGIRRYMETGQRHISWEGVELPGLHKDGHELSLEVSFGETIKDGEHFFAGVIRDISQRKRAEEALRESERRYRTIVESEPECVKVLTRDGILLEINPAGLAVLEADAAEPLIGQSILPLVLPEFRDFFLAFLQRVAAGQRETLQFQIQGLRGNVRSMETHASPVEMRKGEPPAVLCITRDVTDRMRLEEQFRQSQKMEAVGQLAGGVAHDFNNLLGVILGYADLALQVYPKDEKLAAHIGEIQKAGRRAANLTRQLLAFSRQQVLETRVVDLNAVVHDVEKMLARLIGEDIELRTTLQEGLGHVKADPGQLEQIIVNLAVNARDAMPQGGRLTIETANVTLDEAYTAQHFPAKAGPYILMAVSDTGTGMDEKTRARVFEPFFTTKEKGKGTGLGLSTVYGIVKQSGGLIWLYSEPGAGTTFKVYLPRVDSQPHAGTVTEEPRRVRGSETILLAEDEAALRKLTREILERHGYRVLEAEDAPHALELAASYKETIHLLLTDVVMPVMSGRVLALKLAESHAETRVLFVSGYTDDAIVRHQVLEAGTAFLQKPYSSSKLTHKVREVLDGQSASKQ